MLADFFPPILRNTACLHVIVRDTCSEFRTVTALPSNSRRGDTSLQMSRAAVGAAVLIAH